MAMARGLVRELQAAVSLAAQLAKNIDAAGKAADEAHIAGPSGGYVLPGSGGHLLNGGMGDGRGIVLGPDGNLVRGHGVAMGPGNSGGPGMGFGPGGSGPIGSSTSGGTSSGGNTNPGYGFTAPPTTYGATGGSPVLNIGGKSLALQEQTVSLLNDIRRDLRGDGGAGARRKGLL